MNPKYLFIGLMIINIILTSIGANIEKSIHEPKEVKCYDRLNQEIIGTKCITNPTKYYILFFTLFTLTSSMLYFNEKDMERLRRKTR